MPVKTEHCPFQLFFFHLAVCNGDPEGRQKPLKILTHAADILYPVMYEENLPVSREFVFDRLFDHLPIEQRHDAFDRESLFRGSFYDAQTSYIGHGHRESPGDRRCGEGDDIDRFLQLLYPFLLSDAEPVLFVDNEKAELVE